MAGTPILVSLAMSAFAANSVFARLALGGAKIDAAGYSGIRLLSGALALGLILIIQRRPLEISARLRGGAAWFTTAALFGYAIAFSYAYELLGTGTGSLILFATVQIGMLGWALAKGDRPRPIALAGMAVALAATIYLVSPGLSAPDPFGAVLMILAGISWAVYSMLGRGSKEPLIDTACNFVLTIPAALILCALSFSRAAPSAAGLSLAIASGALASGIGYAIWYGALPKLTRSSAAFVQMSVPVIAAMGGIVFIGEALTWRLAISSILILGGLAAAISAPEEMLK